MTATTELVPAVAVAVACRALGVSRAGFYRRQQPRRVRNAPTTRQAATRRATPRALSQDERQNVLAVLNSPRFVDQAPAQVNTALLDEGVYYCSTRTMYRVLDD